MGRGSVGQGLFFARAGRCGKLQGSSHEDPTAGQGMTSGPPPKRRAARMNLYAFTVSYGSDSFGER